MSSLPGYRVLSRPWAPPRASISGVAPRALVVDDNRHAAQALAPQLSLHDIPCCPLYACKHAISAALACPQPGVLKDISMPEIDGIETARNLRAALEVIEIAIVAHTAMDATDEQRRSTGNEFDGHRRKRRSADEVIGLLSPFIALPQTAELESCSGIAEPLPLSASAHLPRGRSHSQPPGIVDVEPLFGRILLVGT